MNPIGPLAEEALVVPAARPPTPPGAASCLITVLPRGDACGATATGRIVWHDRTKTPACADCALQMAQSAGAAVVGFEPIDKPWPVGTKNNPSRFSCYDKAAPDEPMFTLLARDPAAPALVRAWAAQHADKPEKAEEARSVAAAMETWRKEHR